MGFLNAYAGPAENFILTGAPAFFCAFLLYVLAARLASGEDCIARLNRTHLLFFLPYALASVFFSYLEDRLDLSLLPAFAAGWFIYFSLHYIYLQALVGLAKKSVSINLLADIRDLSAGGQGGTVTITALLRHEKAKVDYIRRNRLGQMAALGMAELRQSEYRITPRGRFLNRLGNTILKLWNLRRL